METSPPAFDIYIIYCLIMGFEKYKRIGIFK